MGLPLGGYYAKVRKEHDIDRPSAAGGLPAVGVWLALRARAGVRSRLCGPFSPSIGTLAKDLRMSPRAVQRAVTALEASGLLGVERIPGRKPSWTLLGVELDPRLTVGGQPVENETQPPTDSQGTPATQSGDPRHTVTPAPPDERNEYREIRSIGGDELRKISDEETEAFRTRVHHFGDLLGQLLSKEPDSETAEVLEGLTIDARDIPAWDALIELAERAIQLSPNLQAADA